MKRWEAWWNHAALAAVSLTGLAYGVFKYFVPNPDPDSRIGHPMQPWLLKAHVLVAPFAVLGIGLLLRRHALARLRKGEQSGRKTGAMMLWIFRRSPCRATSSRSSSRQAPCAGPAGSTPGSASCSGSATRSIRNGAAPTVTPTSTILVHLAEVALPATDPSAAALTTCWRWSSSARR